MDYNVNYAGEKPVVKPELHGGMHCEEYDACTCDDCAKQKFPGCEHSINNECLKGEYDDKYFHINAYSSDAFHICVGILKEEEL